MFNFWNPTSTSKQLQTYQHFVGSINSFVTPSNAGTFALYATGNVEWYLPAITFVVTFVLTRISSQLSFLIINKIIEERG